MKWLIESIERALLYFHIHFRSILLVIVAGQPSSNGCFYFSAHSTDETTNRQSNNWWANITLQAVYILFSIVFAGAAGFQT